MSREALGNVRRAQCLVPRAPPLKLAVISDIHGNQPALEAVLADISGQGITAVYCLGDIAGYGPDVNACCTLVRAHCSVALLGNHDDAVLGRTSTRWFNSYAAQAIEYARHTISPENLSYLTGLPYTHVTETVYLSHGAPLQPQHWEYLGWDNLLENLEAVGSRLALSGHSHLHGAFIHSQQEQGHHFLSGLDHSAAVHLGEGGCLVIAGSVGQPRDGDPRASYVVLDADRRRLWFKRCAYAVAEAQRRIREAGLPERLAARLALGR